MTNLNDTLRNFASGAVDWNKRPVALHFGAAQAALGHLLALQHASVQEGLMTGIHGRLTCVSTRRDLPPGVLLGIPVSIRLITDRGQPHTVNAIISDVQIGQSDGELCVYQLTVCDALSLMDKRTNSRVFRKRSVIDVLATLFNEWQQRSPALARAFEFDLSGLRADRYPPRELTRQVNESDAHFVRRLLRREGITVFAKAGPAKDERPLQGDAPVHTLVCCDDPMSLPQAPAGTVRLHPRDGGAAQRDTVTLFALRRQLAPGKAGRPSWDYKKARIDESSVASSLDQGEAGNDLAKLLTDIAIDIAHAGDSWRDHERLTRARMLAHEFEAERHDGVSSVRDLAVGTWITLTGDPQWDRQRADKRQFVITSIDHDIWNNLPKGLNERVHALFAASRNLACAPARCRPRWRTTRIPATRTRSRACAAACRLRPRTIRKPICRPRICSRARLSARRAKKCSATKTAGCACGCTASIRRITRTRRARAPTATRATARRSAWRRASPAPISAHRSCRESAWKSSSGVSAAIRTGW